MSKRISAFTNDALGNMDAVAVAEAIAQKKVSVEEVTEAAIARAEKVNTELNAIVIKTYDVARNKNTMVNGGDFYGVPAFVKDNDNVGGYPTQHGTGAFIAKKAKQNSGYVKQFFSTGVNFLGKSTMPEFGLICSTENEKWGITRNPWNTHFTTGGSSSGSAALVASGVVPIATANDGAGSIRIPANCCGLVGLKPSRGRLVPMDGTTIMPIQIVYEGVLTRTVRDTAAYYFAAEKFFKNKHLPEIGQVRAASKKRLRIAFMENPAEGKLGNQDKDTWRTQLEIASLLKSMGHTVEQVPVPVDIDKMSNHYLNYYGMMSYFLTSLSPLVVGAKVDRLQLEPFTLGLSQQFKGNKINTISSIRLLRQTAVKAEKLFDNYDVIMTPVVSHKTPEIGHFSPELRYEEIAHRAVAYASYAGLQNISGAPAISLPLGTSEDDMPLGVHFSAPLGQDKRLLELAFELEEAKPWRFLYNH